MAEIDNPYRTPAAPVADVLDDAAPDSAYIEGGRAVDAGRGLSWIREGWGLFRKQAGMWVVLILIFGLLFVGISIIPVLNLLVSLGLPVLVAGLMVGCQAVARGGELELAHLFAGFRRNTGQLILVGVIGLALGVLAIIPMSIILGASIFAAGTANSLPTFGMGMVLAVLVSVALFVPINMAMWFAPALVMLQDQSAPRAIGQSFKGCLKNIVPFLLYGIVLFFLAMLTALTFGLGWLVLGPVVLCSVYVAYRDIYFLSR